MSPLAWKVHCSPPSRSRATFTRKMSPRPPEVESTVVLVRHAHHFMPVTSAASMPLASQLPPARSRLRRSLSSSRSNRPPKFWNRSNWLTVGLFRAESSNPTNTNG